MPNEGLWWKAAEKYKHTHTRGVCCFVCVVPMNDPFRWMRDFAIGFCIAHQIQTDTESNRYIWQKDHRMDGWMNWTCGGWSFRTSVCVYVCLTINWMRLLGLAMDIAWAWLSFGMHNALPSYTHFEYMQSRHYYEYYLPFAEWSLYMITWSRRRRFPIGSSDKHGFCPHSRRIHTNRISIGERMDEMMLDWTLQFRMLSCAQTKQQFSTDYGWHDGYPWCWIFSLAVSGTILQLWIRCSRHWLLFPLNSLVMKEMGYYFLHH